MTRPAEATTFAPSHSGDARSDLVAALNEHWSLQRSSWSETTHLLRLETQLAARSATELVLVGLAAILFVLVALLALQGLITLALIGAGLTPAAALLVVLVLNLALLAMLAWRGMTLREDLTFSATRGALESPDPGAGPART